MKLPAVRPGTGALVGVLVALVATIVVGMTFGLALAILVLAGCVLAGVITLFWLSVRNLSGDTPLSLDEALAMGAPTAAEEEKRAVLRALKDLEFERSVGKISEQDYLEFSARYRAEAKRLIAAVDESLGPVQALAEKLAAERLAAAGLGPGTDDEAKSNATPSAAPQATEPKPEPKEEDAEPKADGDAVASAPSEGQRCAKCETENDLDAAFCKRCGTPLSAAHSEPAPARAVEEEAP